MANRRISDLPEIAGSELADEDLFTVVHVFEVDPALKNKKLTVAGTKQYFDLYYFPRTGGIISGNASVSGNFTVDRLTTTSGLVVTNQATISGLIVQNSATVSGTISGITITGGTLQGSNVNGTTVTATTVNATTVNATSGNFTNFVFNNTLLSLGLGSAAVPSLSFSGDSNTGIYSPGADQLAVATNGTQRLTVDTAATTSTLPVVHPLGAAATPSITFTGDLNTGFWSPSADALAASTAGGERLRITSAGLVGIGTSSPGAGLHIATAGQTTSALDTSGSLNLLVSDTGASAGNGGSIVFGFNSGSGRFASIKGQVITGAGNSTGHLTFSTRNATSDATLTERLRITNDGLVGIGSTTALGYKLNVYESGTGMINALHLGSGGGTAGNGTSISFGLGAGFDPTANILAKIGGIYTGAGYEGALTFHTNPNSDGASPRERARIDSSGRLLVGTSSSLGGGLLQVKGTINIQQASGGADYETAIGSDAVSFVNISTTGVAGLPFTNGPGLYMFTIRTIGNHAGTFLVSVGHHFGANYHYAGFGASGNVTLTNVSNGTITIVLLGDARTYTFNWPTDGQAPNFRASSTATGTTLVAVTAITTAI